MPTAADARPFLWSQGFVDIGRTDGAVVDDVNDRRQVLLAGYPFTASGAAPEWVWDDGTIVDAPIPEGFTQTNFLRPQQRRHGRRYGHRRVLPASRCLAGRRRGHGPRGPSQDFHPSSVNVWGQVVGCTFDPALGRSQMFLWQNGHRVELTALAGEGDVANCGGTGINDRGQVAASVRDASGAGRGVLWTVPVLWGYLQP